MPNQLMHTHLANIHPSTHKIGTCTLIFSRWISFTLLQFTPLFYSLPQPHHVMASHSSLGDKPLEHVACCIKKFWSFWSGHETQSSTYATGLSTPYLWLIAMQPPLSTVFCPRAPSHHPSNLTSVYHVPALHFLPSPSFWPGCTYFSILSMYGSPLCAVIM